MSNAGRRKRKRKTHLLCLRRLDRLDPLPALHRRPSATLPLRHQETRIDRRLLPPLRRRRSLLIVERRGGSRSDCSTLRLLILLRLRTLAFRLASEGVDRGLEALLFALGGLFREKARAISETSRRGNRKVRRTFFSAFASRCNLRSPASSSSSSSPSPSSVDPKSESNSSFSSVSRTKCRVSLFRSSSTSPIAKREP